MSNLQRPMLALTVLLLFSSGCVNLARRYRNKGDVYEMYHTLTPGQVLEYANIDLTGRNVPATATSSTVPIPFVLALTEKGQAEYIKALAGKNDTAKVVMRNIMANIPSSKKDMPIRVKVIPKVVTKALNFSVHRRASGGNPKNAEYYIFDEADRISLLEFYLHIRDTAVVFNDWDRYVSVYGSVDLGKVTSAQNWSATANLSANATGGVTLKDTNSASNIINSLFSNSNTGKNTSTVSGTTNNSSSLDGITNGTTTASGAGTENVRVTNAEDKVQRQGGTGSENTTNSSFNIGPSVSATVGDKYETAQNLIFQRLSLSGTLHEDSLFLRQEGAQGIDLSANTAVSVEFRTTAPWASPLKVDKFSQLYDKDNKPQKENKLKPSFMFLIYPDMKDSIYGDFRYKYIYREVQKGSRHLPEARQKVKFQYGEVGFKGQANSNSETGTQDFDLYRDQAVNDKLLNKAYNNSVKITENTKSRLTKNAAIEYYGRRVPLLGKNDFRPITYRLGMGSTGSKSKRFITYDGVPLEFETLAEATDFLAYIYYSVSTSNVFTKIKIQGVSASSSTTAITPAMFKDAGSLKAITPLAIQN